MDIRFQELKRGYLADEWSYMQAVEQLQMLNYSSFQAEKIVQQWDEEKARLPLAPEDREE